MDFSFTPEQEALRELARRILDDHVTHQRLKAAEADPDWFDREAWRALAEARLLGVALPEDVGGSGLGFLELCLLLEQVGRAVAPVPVFPTLVGILFALYPSGQGTVFGVLFALGSAGSLFVGPVMTSRVSRSTAQKALAIPLALGLLLMVVSLVFALWQINH